MFDQGCADRYFILFFSYLTNIHFYIKKNIFNVKKQLNYLLKV